MTTTRQQVEDLSKAHPELSWSAFEQNAAELYEIDSDEYFDEMLYEALAATHDWEPCPADRACAHGEP